MLRSYFYFEKWHTIITASIIVLFPILEIKAELCFIEGNSYDFGEVWPSQCLSHLCWITNRSERLIKIEKISTSCSCTVVEFHDYFIKAFQARPLKIELRTPDREQRVNQQVLLSWRYQDSVLTNLFLFSIKAKVVKITNFNPLRWDFDMVSHEDLPLMKTIKISSADQNNIWDELEAHVQDRELETKVNKVKKGEYLVQVKLKEGIYPGNFSSSVIFNFRRNGKLLPLQMSVPVEGMIINDFIISPGTIFVSDMEPTTDKLIVLKIFHNGSEPFQLLSATSTSPENVNLIIPKKIKFAKECNLKCVIHATKGISQLTGKIEIALVSRAKKRTISASYLICINKH